MPFTQTDLAALDAAIASGERRVSYGDRTVEYQSLKEMMAARRLIQSELNPEGPQPRRGRLLRVFQSGRG